MNCPNVKNVDNSCVCFWVLVEESIYQVDVD